MSEIAPRPAADASRPSIVVIGAGPSGLGLAWRLAPR